MRIDFPTVWIVVVCIAWCIEETYLQLDIAGELMKTVQKFDVNKIYLI